MKNFFNFFIIVLMFTISSCQTNQITENNISPSAIPAHPAQKVENFALLDQNGEFHELYYYSDKNAIVLIVQGNGCPIIRKSMAYIRQLKNELKPRGVVFLMINANTQDDRDSIANEIKDFGIDISVLEDKSQLIADEWGLTRTAEAILINPKDWQIAYRGPIHDQFDYEVSKGEIKNHYLKEAIESLIQSKPIRPSNGKVRGCLINTSHSQKKVTYTEDITPILMRSCIPCHQDGGIAPWRMDSYEKVKGWGKMIREVVMTKRMPPWHADPQYGKFKNDLSLKPEDVRRIIQWIDQGFIRGQGKDPLRDRVSTINNIWPLGQPDLVFSMKEEQQISESGRDDFKNIIIEQPILEDIWVRALDLRPSNAKAVHHANVVLLPPEKGLKQPGNERTNSDLSKDKDREDWFMGAGLGAGEGRIISGYAPGSGPFELPEGTGIFIPKGTRLEFRMHYIPTGKPEKDLTRLGIYLHKTKPPHILSVAAILDRSLKIPAGEKKFKIQGSMVFQGKSILLALTPHMHYRGRSMRFTLIYPDGKSEIILSVPNYRFRWQRQYVLKEPKDIPAGTKVLLEATYDNSSQNPDNPDPSQEVLWGPKSGDEMFLGLLYYVAK